jgi:hypothetical protein
MATIVTPTEEQWETLREIGIFDEADILLVSPAAQKELGLDDPEKLEEFSKKMENYDFGGGPDISMDVAATTRHYALRDWDRKETAL